MNRIWNLPQTALIPFSDIEERRPALVVTSAPAWEAVKGQLRGLRIADRVEVTEATTEQWDNLLSLMEIRNSVMLDLPLELVYAVGGGLVADAAKYMAAKLGLPLTVLPTALSVDAFITAASGIRKYSSLQQGDGSGARDGCVYYIETKVPETLVLDLDIIAAAPTHIRAAGITDVMSIATGSWDWKFAHEHGQNPPGMEFIPWAYDNARSILNGVLDCAEAAGRGDRDGLKTLYDCLAMEVQLCNQVGHARPEEGSEHYFAYCAENFTGHGWPHGDLVGPGIMIMSRLQGQDTGRYESALKACNVPLDRIPADITDRTLQRLPSYCKKHGLAFGLAHTLGA
jgi:glycerol-1-phosphate dehydrogenase [NAD(P)+]